MFGVTTSDDYRPVTWMGRIRSTSRPLVVVHVVCAVLTCFLVAAGGGALLNFILFDSAQVLGAASIWQLATYAFVHPPSASDLVRDRNVHALRLRPRSGTFHRPARLHLLSTRSCFSPVAFPHLLGLVDDGPDWPVQPRCISESSSRSRRFTRRRNCFCASPRNGPRLFWPRSTSCNCWPTMSGPISRFS